ncbi:RNA polymerase sigma factor [Halobacillus sp. A5]|uniref:RNA polymerase sigma factor n=1 Tax=Halobacillus sp. A5 TaxID=2880263 RepID=UPI0020A6CF0D|nr:RNA polymerase sigma factor [Halobacillus sp. A5]
MDTDMERKLIKKVKKGNQKAFKKLYDLYSGYALRTAFAMTKSEADASDIVQETFIRVYRSIDSFEEAKPFKPWFYRILINETHRLLKKRADSRNIYMDVEASEFLHPASSIEGDYEDLGEALDQLDHHHKTVVVLKYLHGFSEKEIASILDENQNTIKSRLYKGRQKLKQVLGAIEHE